MSRLPPPRGPIADDSLVRPDWTLRARDTDGLIALDKNENTDPVFRAELARILSSLPANSVVEYPECAPYYALLAKHLELSPRNLLFTPGADGAIRTVFEAFVATGDVVMMPAPTFAMFPIYAQMYGGRRVEAVYEDSASGPSLTAARICQMLRDCRPRLFCLANPDSPTGTIFPLADMKTIIRTAADLDTVVMIDEAYYPFSDVTVIDLIDDFANLVVGRTFAKAWGLAGLRLGFATAHPNMAAVLHRVRPMYEVNGFALAAMSALIERQDLVGETVRRINTGKRYFLDRMRRHNLRALDGAGNFLHIDFGERRAAVFAALDGKVLFKRSFADPCLAGFSRFSAAPENVMARVADLIDGALR